MVVLITDQANERIIEVDVATKGIIWQYVTTGVSGNGPNELNNPNCAELLENGHILICDENNNRAIEVTRNVPLGGDIVWQYGSGDPAKNKPVSGVAFASRLENGHTLITDSNHSRIVEIDEDKHVVWQYFTCHRCRLQPVARHWSFAHARCAAEEQSHPHQRSIQPPCY
jgi:hypothetical protein